MAVRSSECNDNLTYTKRFSRESFVQNIHKAKILNLCTLRISGSSPFTNCIKNMASILLLPSNCSKLTPVSTENTNIANKRADSFVPEEAKAIDVNSPYLTAIVR